MNNKFCESELTLDEVERYSRQIILPGIQVDGQVKIRSARVLIIGCGGLGAPALMYLASCGIGKIGLVDFDKIELHNLQRQIIYNEHQLNEGKVENAAKFASSLNKSIMVVAHNELLNIGNIKRVFKEYDIILDCSDDINTRYLISSFCSEMGKDLICASVLKWEGQVYVFPKNGPCYSCVFSAPKESPQTCEDGGVLGPICGVIGCIQATETIKLITGGQSEPRMMVYNGLRNTLTSIKMRRKTTKCKLCAGIGNKVVDPVKECPEKKAEKKPNPEYKDVPVVTWKEVFDDFDNYVIVDIRPAIQHEIFRVKNSVNVPMTILSKASLEEYLDDGKTLAIVCRRGITSLRAAHMLIKTKSINCVSIEGGIDEFKKFIVKLKEA